MSTTEIEKGTKQAGIGLFGLVGLVVSSCIGTGVFALTGQLASVASPGASIIAWLIVGCGFLALALSLNNLMAKRPDVNNIFAYGTEGFGSLAGFVSGWGYWLSAWLGNVAFATILASTIGYFIPYFLPGNNIGSIALASVINWSIVLLIIRGVESASFLNAIIMVVKVSALVVFSLLCGVAFNAGIFTADFWGNVYNAAVEASSVNAEAVSLGSIPTQISNCIIVMMWVFIGVEGANVVTARAKKRSQAGTATVLGLIIVLVLYLGASLLPYGVMPYSEVAALDYPAMLYVFEHVAPGWGGTFIAIAMLFSGFGCWLSFTLLPAEVTKDMAHDRLLGSWWAKLNPAKAPRNSLIVVGCCTQAFMISLLFTEDAYNFALSLCTCSIAVTWALAAAYQAKLAIRERDATQAALGLVALAFLVIGTLLSGWQYLLLCCIGYLPGFFFYAKGRREFGERAFERQDYGIVAVIAICAAAALVLLGIGVITV